MASEGQVVKVFTDGEDEKTITIKSRHIIAWEKMGKGRAAGRLDGANVSLTDVYELTWIALGRPGKLDDFMLNTDLEMNEEAPDLLTDPKAK